MRVYGVENRVKSKKVDVRLPGKRNSKSHGARPVHLIITVIKRIQTRKLSIKNFPLSRLKSIVFGR